MAGANSTTGAFQGANFAAGGAEPSDVLREANDSPLVENTMSSIALRSASSAVVRKKIGNGAPGSGPTWTLGSRLSMRTFESIDQPEPPPAGKLWRASHGM